MTLTDIIGYLPHKLAVVSEHGTIRRIYGTNNIDVVLDEYRPVLRPMSDLITEITEKEYNDGKPFVPIVKLVEATTGFQGARVLGELGLVQIETENWVYKYSLRWHPKLRTFSFAGSEDNKRFPMQSVRRHAIWNQYKVYDLLHAWHFDYRGLIEQGDAVNVHDLDENPYE